MLKISVITPCFNEELNVEECAIRLARVFSESLPDYKYEHIFSDNASTDNTLKILKDLAGSDNRIKIISNSRNVGPFRNMWNAMKSSTGDVVIPMLPADLQDPPELIPKFINEWQSGNLVVYGIRINRQEPIHMRALRSIYYRIVAKFASSKLPLHAGEFMAVDRRVVNSILSLNDQYPYIRGLVAQSGVKSTKVEYRWEKRLKGKSKNNFIDLIDQAINGFISTSRIPARFALLCGFLISLIGMALALINLGITIFSDNVFPQGIPTIIIGMFLFGGLQLLFLGLIGEYVLSIHGQIKPEPPMFEIERINFDIIWKENT